MLKIGVDIGGTFTDFAAWRDDGSQQVITLKVPSTPPAFAEGFKAGCEEILKRMPPRADEQVFVMHGTTVSTNTVIERNGPCIALLTTAGFKDILELQRLRLRKAIDLFGSRVEPLVARELVFEIPERVGADGQVRQALDLAAVESAARAAAQAGAEGVAIAFLHAYRNPQHELAARRAVQQAGLANVSISSEIWPKIGEYERAIVAVLNTYVKPRMSAYIGEVEQWLASRLPRARLFIMQSNGGALAAPEARAFPVHTLLSGPSSGVTAAQFIAAELGERRFLTMDMGGTSSDLSLILDGEPTITGDAEVGDFPLMMPVTGIEAIGAGGGSICWMDGGVLRVGPRSAGARPGPACFGHGGTQPTITDAYLLCGYLNPENFLGGRMRLDRVAAEAAMSGVADALGVDLARAAESCITVATSNMVASVLPYLARHGLDPEDITLVLYGGAGSLHGPLLAADLGVPRVLVPGIPSVFCAFGGLVAGLVHDTVATVHGATLDIEALQHVFDEKEHAARAWLDAQGVTSLLTGIVIEHWAEMRYRGQSFQLSVHVPQAALAQQSMALVEAAFHEEHERLYTHADPSAAVEFTELRVRIRGLLPAPRLREQLQRAGCAEQALSGHRDLHIGGHLYRDSLIYQREKLVAGDVIKGAAVIEQVDTTILVPAGWLATVGRFGDILMTRRG